MKDLITSSKMKYWGSYVVVQYLEIRADNIFNLKSKYYIFFIIKFNFRI